MNWQERIATDETIMTGKPVVKGTRMTVEFVVGLLGGGWSLDRILQEYDHLTKEDIQACLAGCPNGFWHEEPDLALRPHAFRS